MFKNMMTAAAVCLILFLILESLCRAAGFYPVNSDFQPVMRSQEMGWTLKPNYQTVWQELEWRVPYETNSLGFRDQEPSAAKLPGKRRILTLGDSFAEGYGVTLQAMWQTRLRELLKGSFEIINLGVRGYDILQEYQQFLDSGGQFAPDAVIQILNDSDFHSSEWAIVDTAGQLRPEFKIVNGRLQFLPAFAEAPQTRLQSAGIQHFRNILYRSAFFAWLRRAWEQAFWKWTAVRRIWNRTALELTRDGGGQPASEYAQYYETAVRIAYQDMAAKARAQNIKLLVVWASPRPMPARLAFILDQSEIKHMTFLLNKEDQFRYDAHPNAQGHEKIAQAIYDFIVQKAGWPALLGKV